MSQPDVRSRGRAPRGGSGKRPQQMQKGSASRRALPNSSARKTQRTRPSRRSSVLFCTTKPLAGGRGNLRTP